MALKTVVPDEELAARVRRSFAEDANLGGSDFRVDVVDGVIRVLGVCSNLRQVRRVEEVAAQVPGALAIENLLTVECAQPPTDEELQARAQAAAATADARV